MQCRYFFEDLLRALDLAADFLLAAAFFVPALAVELVLVAFDLAFFVLVFFGFSPKMLSQFFQNSGVVPVRTIGPLVGIGTYSSQIFSVVCEPTRSIPSFLRECVRMSSAAVVLPPEIVSTIINRPYSDDGVHDEQGGAGRLIRPLQATV